MYSGGVFIFIPFIHLIMRDITYSALWARKSAHILFCIAGTGLYLSEFGSNREY